MSFIIDTLLLYKHKSKHDSRNRRHLLSFSTFGFLKITGCLQDLKGY